MPKSRFYVDHFCPLSTHHKSVTVLRPYCKRTWEMQLLEENEQERWIFSLVSRGHYSVLQKSLMGTDLVALKQLWGEWCMLTYLFLQFNYKLPEDSNVAFTFILLTCSIGHTCHKCQFIFVSVEINEEVLPSLLFILFLTLAFWNSTGDSKIKVSHSIAPLGTGIQGILQWLLQWIWWCPW